ncbi:MAG: phenylacetate--CoA ligase family protein, partial [Phycisphaerae bacterium]
MYSLLVRNLIYPLDRWRSGEVADLHYLRRFERSQYWPKQKHERQALCAIRSLVAHAYANCPFYRRHLNGAGIRPQDIRALEHVAALPILDKAHIRAHQRDMIARNLSRKDLVLVLTGGSTAMPLSFYVTRERMCSRAAATWRHNRWAGWDIGDKAAAIWGAARDAPPPTWKSRLRNLVIDRMLFLNTACLTESKMGDFSRQLKRFRPKVILAYTKSAVLFAQFLKERGILPYQPQAMVVSAETLEDWERQLLEEVFGCRVFNRYGCREVSVVASECEEHHGMHTMAEGLYIEVVRDGRPARPGELGEILVTDLLNYAMPLIRYRILDVGTRLEGECACGRGLPRLGRLAGRITDFLVGSDGRLVSGLVLGIAVDQVLSLGQAQIIQERQGEVLFRIVPLDRRPPERDLQFLRNEARAYLGRDTVVEFEFVDHIPPEPSGKYRFCI